MALDVKHALIEKIKTSPHVSLHIVVSTDVTNIQNLLYYASYEISNNIKEDMLYCEIWLTRTTSENIFVKLNIITNEHELDWEKYVGMCTERAAAMVECQDGVVVKVTQVATEVKITHCC